MGDSLRKWAINYTSFFKLTIKRKFLSMMNFAMESGGISLVMSLQEERSTPPWQRPHSEIYVDV